MDRDNLIASLSDAFNKHEDEAKEKEQKAIETRYEEVRHAIDMGLITEEDVYKRLHSERRKEE